MFAACWRRIAEHRGPRERSGVRTGRSRRNCINAACRVVFHEQDDTGWIFPRCSARVTHFCSVRVIRTGNDVQNRIGNTVVKPGASSAESA